MVLYPLKLYRGGGGGQNKNNNNNKPKVENMLIFFFCFVLDTNFKNIEITSVSTMILEMNITVILIYIIKWYVVFERTGHLYSVSLFVQAQV